MWLNCGELVACRFWVHACDLFQVSGDLELEACSFFYFLIFFLVKLASTDLRYGSQLLDPVSHFNTTTIRLFHSYQPAEMRYWLKFHINPYAFTIECI